MKCKPYERRAAQNLMPHNPSSRWYCWKDRFLEAAPSAECPLSQVCLAKNLFLRPSAGSCCQQQGKICVYECCAPELASFCSANLARTPSSQHNLSNPMNLALIIQQFSHRQDNASMDVTRSRKPTRLLRRSSASFFCLALHDC